MIKLHSRLLKPCGKFWCWNWFPQIPLGRHLYIHKEEEQTTTTKYLLVVMSDVHIAVWISSTLILLQLRCRLHHKPRDKKFRTRNLKICIKSFFCFETISPHHHHQLPIIITGNSHSNVRVKITWIQFSVLIGHSLKAEAWLVRLPPQLISPSPRSPGLHPPQQASSHFSAAKLFRPLLTFHKTFVV